MRKIREQELVERLLEYRKLKDAAQSFAEIRGSTPRIWTRPKADGGNKTTISAICVRHCLVAQDI